jgi:hypothetical protein
LIKDFRFYLSKKECIKNRNSGLLDVEHNRNNFQRKDGVDKNLGPEEWKEAVFRIWEKRSLLPDIEAYECMLIIFETIVGMKPEGIITGHVDEGVNAEGRSPWNVTGMDCQKSYIGKLLSNIEIAKKETTGPITSSNSGYLYKLSSGKELMDLNKIAKIENRKLEEEISQIVNHIQDIEKPYSFKEFIYNNILETDIVHPGSQSNRQIFNRRPMNVTRGRMIEDQFIKAKSRRKNCKNEFIKISDNFFLPLKNKFAELEVEEAIALSDETVDSFISSGLSVQLMTDFKKRRSFREKKLKTVDFSLKGYDREMSFNNFNVNNNSNANKNYNVTNLSVYLKILLAMKCLKLHSKKEIYIKFGLKKCQSTYAVKNLVKLMNSSRKMVDFFLN